MVTVSVIVLSHGSREKGNCLETTLQSIIQQKNDNTEVILVDNNPQNKQISVDVDLPVKVIRADNVPRGVARNYGARIATGDVLVFLDDDTFIVTPDALSKVEHFSLGYNYGYGAKRTWIFDVDEFSRHKEEIERRLRLGNWTGLLGGVRQYLPDTSDGKSLDLSRFSFPGNFGFVRRNLFHEIGGFNPQFRGYGNEDDFFAYNLFEANPMGFKFLFDDVSVAHINHPIRDGQRVYGEGVNHESYQQLLKSRGVAAFNINVLFGIPEYDGQPVIEKI